MCIIIDNRKGLPMDPLIADRSTLVNPDGYTRLDLRDMSVIKTLDMLKAERILMERIPAIHHARYATVGDVTLNNLHPFDIDKDWMLFMNGTVEGMRCEGKETDSARLAKALAHVPPDNYEAFLRNFDARFTLVNRETRAILNVGKFIEHDGMLFSKEDVLPRHMVAVYGTLKRNHGNHYLLTRGGARFQGTAHTKEVHRMPDPNRPVVFQGPNKEGKGARVAVEVYEVPKALLEGDLDRLEGHPDWYRRKMVPVVFDITGRTEYAWLYFMREDDNWAEDTGGPYYPCYRPEASVRPIANRTVVRGYGHGHAFSHMYEEQAGQLSLMDEEEEEELTSFTREDVKRARQWLKDMGVDEKTWDDGDVVALLQGGFEEQLPSGPRCPRCDTHMDEDDNWVWCDECGHFQHISRTDRERIGTADKVEGL